MVFTKELDCVVALHREVVRFNGRGELQLLHSVCRLWGAGIFGSLGLLVEELPVIYDAADGRCGVCGNLNKVEAFALCQPQGIIQRHDTELLLGFVENPHLSGTDFSVSAMQWFARLE